MSFVIPLLISAALGGLSSASQKKPKLDKIDTLNPEQQQLQSGILQMLQKQLGGGGIYQQGQDYLQNLLSGSPEAFKNFEAPFTRQFQEQTVPGLAERFSGLGAGAQGSSAFGQALGQAGAGLSENLAALRSGLQMQAAPQAFQSVQSLFGTSMQSSFDYLQQPGGGFWSKFLGGLGSGSSKGLGQISGLMALKRFFPEGIG